MARLMGVLGLVTALCVATSAQATVHSQTSYNYFAVRGKTSREIYINLTARGPSAGGADAMATTNVSLSQHALLSSGSSCRMENFSANLTFKINLPRLQNAAALAPAARRSWSQFSSTLKAHEEHHRAIWIACAHDLSTQVMSIKAGPCASFKASYTAISKTVLAQCKAKNRAFDAAEGVRFLTTPFIRQVAVGN